MGRSDELSGPLAEWTPEKSVAEMDRNGVEYAVLSLTAPAVWLGDVQVSRKLARRCNEYAAKIAAKYAGRFGFADAHLDRAKACGADRIEHSSAGEKVGVQSPPRFRIAR